MHVVIIGAGVIGVTTAYYVSKLGYQVTVIDRATAVGDGASFGNAGQLAYSYADAFANPAFLARIPGIIGGRDPGCRVRIHPELIPWGLRFLSECTGHKAKENTVTVLKIALQSEQLLKKLRQQLPFDFSHRPAGKLVLLASQEAVKKAQTSAALKRDYGCETEVLSREASIEMEPALADMPVDFCAAVYSRQDSVGDSYKFTTSMRHLLEKSANVKFRLGVNVRRLVEENRKLKCVELDDGEIAADAAIVCSGAWSGQLLKSVNINPHIYPVRGYSVTLPTGTSAPAMSVTVLNKRTVFSRINGELRISGFADFLGFNDSSDERRTADLLDVAREIAPHAADYGADQQHWGGFRPMTPNGRPLVGPTKIDRLFLNTGHGMLGWTLACASSHTIARTVAWSLR